MPESARESLEAELFRSTFWFQLSILIFLTFMQLTFVFVVPTWPLLLGLIYLVPLSIILVARLLISLDDDERRVAAFKSSSLLPSPSSAPSRSCGWCRTTRS